MCVCFLRETEREILCWDQHVMLSSDGGLTHMERAGTASSSSETSAFLGELRGQKICLVLDHCQWVDRCSLESVTNQVFLLSAHLSFCSGRTCSIHLGDIHCSYISPFALGIFFLLVLHWTNRNHSPPVFSSFFLCRLSSLFVCACVCALMLCLCLIWRRWSRIFSCITLWLKTKKLCCTMLYDYAVFSTCFCSMGKSLT